MEGGVISVPARVSRLANKEFKATPTPSPPDESAILRELNVSGSLAGLVISRDHNGELDVLGQRHSTYKPMARTFSKMHMAAKAKAKARAEMKAAAVDKAKAAAVHKAKTEKAAVVHKAKVKKSAAAAAADDKAKAVKEAAAAGAASPERLSFDPYEGYGIKKKVMVKMDERNSYIKWLLKWDKKPRPPLPNLPEESREEYREAMDAIKAERDHHERVLVDFKRDGHAYIQIDVFNDDDPRTKLPDDQYDVIHHDIVEEGEEEERILGRL